MRELSIIQVGVGPIGQRIVRYALERHGLEVIGAVDPDPEKMGRDLGEVCGLGRDLDVMIAPSLELVLESCQPDVAVVATTSSIEKAVPQIEEIVERGLHVVSTCEELAYPWQTAPKLARQLDAAALKNGVAVLGTGVNPGFLMDFRALALTAICQRVDRIKVSRIQDASIRRIPFQQKIGAGLTLEEFEAKKQAGTLRHVGLTESIQMIASRLHWTLDKVEDILTPIVAEAEITAGGGDSPLPIVAEADIRGGDSPLKRGGQSPYRPIAKGMAAGVQQIGRGWVGGKERITLEFRAAVGEPDPRDTVRIEGEPTFESTIPGGINGDVATCAIIVNAIESIVRAPAGLRTMADMPPVSFFGA